MSRFRNFATVVYPESAPQDWQEILADELIPAFISPLHDRDINPGGEPKKPHYHVMIMFDGVKTEEQAREVFSKIGGVGCEVIKSLRGYARYLCHKDNPEKTQYDENDVRCFCGADYYGICNLVVDKYKALKEMTEFCSEAGIMYFSDLWEYCMVERFDWFRVLCDSGSLPMKEYLKTKGFKAGLNKDRL